MISSVLCVISTGQMFFYKEVVAVSENGWHWQIAIIQWKQNNNTERRGKEHEKIK